MVRPRAAWLVFSMMVCSLVASISCATSAQATTYGGVTFPLGDVSFADRVVTYVEGSCVRCAFSHPAGVIGPPDCGGTGCQACSSCDPCALSLGFRLSELDNRGYVTVEFVDNRLIDGPGNDLLIYITNDKAARVDISADGMSFISVGQTKGYPGAIDIGPFVQPGQEFRFVRVWDVPGDEDKTSCTGPSIDAIGAMGRALLAQYTLNVTIVGSGSVTKTPDQTTYAQGTSVSLQATSAAGWNFVGWSGDASGSTNPLQLTMDANKSITATFAAVSQGVAQGTLAILPAAGDLAFTTGLTTTHLLILLDVSTSMGEAFEDSTKLEVAKRVLTELVDTFPSGIDIGLRTFGGCDEDSVLLLPIGPLDRTVMKARIQQIQLGGATAIQYALEQAKLDFTDISGARQILLLSDGGEDCSGNPVAYVRQLIASGYALRINVIGYGVIAGDQATRQQLEELAKITGGTFVLAQTSQDLRAALQLSSPITRYHVFDSQGTETYSGVLGDTGPLLPAGTYHVVIDTTPPVDLPSVTVQGGHTTQVTLKRTDGGYSASVQ